MASGPGDLVYDIVSSTSEHASFHVHERLQAFNIDLVLDQVGIEAQSWGMPDIHILPSYFSGIA